MNKEEILRKSREDYSEKEGILKEHQKNVRPIFIAVFVAAVFLIWLNSKYIESEIVSNGVFMMVWAIISADSFYSFFLSGKKIWLVLGILGAVDAVLRVYNLLDFVKNFM